MLPSIQTGDYIVAKSSKDTVPYTGFCQRIVRYEDWAKVYLFNVVDFNYSHVNSSIYPLGGEVCLFTEPNVHDFIVVRSSTFHRYDLKFEGLLAEYLKFLILPA
jgi:hypothetical protein